MKFINFERFLCSIIQESRYEHFKFIKVILNFDQYGRITNQVQCIECDSRSQKFLVTLVFMNVTGTRKVTPPPFQKHLTIGLLIGF